jgi:hypothetical protein
VKPLDMQYMRAQLAKAGTPAPKAIGIDEISIRKGHVSHRGQRSHPSAADLFRRTSEAQLQPARASAG